MSDDCTPRDGYSSASAPDQQDDARSFMERLRDQTAAILDGTDERDDSDPHAAGVRLGSVLTASRIGFRISWDGIAPGLAQLLVDRTAIEHFTASGVDADPYDVDDRTVSYLLTGPQCHAVADVVEATWTT